MIDIFSSKPGFGILVGKCGTYFTLHDVHHLLTDGSDLGGLSVGGLLDLVLSSLGETNAKESELVSVSGCTINVSFNLGLPLLDDGALFVTGQFHTVEVGQTVVTLDFFADQSRITIIKSQIMIMIEYYLNFL